MKRLRIAAWIFVVLLNGFGFFIACASEADDETACTVIRPVNPRVSRCEWFAGEICYVVGSDGIDCIEKEVR